MSQERWSLITYLCFFNRCDEEDLNFKIAENKRGNFWFIQNFKLCTRYNNKVGKKIRIYAKGITDKSSRELYAFRYYRNGINVESYYKNKYNITLAFPELPCIYAIRGLSKCGDPHIDLFPIELIDILGS